MESKETIQTTPRSEEQWTERQRWELTRLQDQLAAYSKNFRCKVLSALLAEAEAMPDDDGELGEPAGEPGLAVIRRWTAERTFSEKLTAILLWQLSNKDSTFEKPDRHIADELFNRWEEEITAAIEDVATFISEHQQKLDVQQISELLVVAAKVATWIPMQV